MAEKYPSNSNKMREASLIREPEKAESKELTVKAEPVETRTIETRKDTSVVRARKVSTFKQVVAVLFPDGLEGIKDHLIWDVFVPRMADLLHNGWDDVGDVLFSGGATQKKSGGYASYDSSYKSRNTRNTRSYESARTTPWYDYREAVFDTRVEAERRLDTLQGILTRYKVLRLIDYNGEMGFPTQPTQVDWGWLSLHNARIERTFDRRWVLVMPRPVEID